MEVPAARASTASLLSQPERAEDYKNDVDKSYGVPDKQKRLRKLSAHSANHS